MLSAVVIEVRKHLCCANVFLNLSHPISESQSIKIDVENKLIRLKDAAGIVVAEINTGRYFTILTETLSNLIADGENISFRLRVENIGDLEIQDKKQNKILNFLLKENEQVSLHCRQCESTLCPPKKYEKIREFPSGAIDVSEFFCHHGPSFSDVLLPRTQDIFYGFQFVIVNNANVESSIKEKEAHVYCKRCKRYFGETMFEKKAVKLWSDSVIFKKSDDLKQCDFFDVEENNMPAMLLLKVIKESSLPSPEPLLKNMHFTKVLLETTLPSRERQYLLVHVLEKNLPVLLNKPKPSNDEIEPRLSFKLLYQHIEPEKRDDKADKDEVHPSYPAIFSYWQQDINILKLSISPFLFSQLLNELESNALLFPEVYRYNDDQFTLSYIYL